MTTATRSRTSSRVELTGSQEPTRLVVPEYTDSEWRDCHAVNSAGGLDMLEWQDGVMQGWLGRNRLGRWSAPTCAGSIPRQNGKTIGLVVPRCNYGMLILKEEIIYTSHLQKTSTETFESIATFFDSPKLRKYVKDIKTALGREQVILKNGARIKFLARTRNGGRGQHGDLLIFDEALELSPESQASFLPAISASSNPQAIYISTPPTGRGEGAVFRGIRERALAGKSDRTAWFEWSVDEIGDIDDRARWYATNPSLGLLIAETTVEAEAEQMDSETFARERLGWWDDVSTAYEPVMTRGEWDRCATEHPCKDGLLVYAVKFPPDGSTAALSVCRRPEDGTPHIEVVQQRTLNAGLGWLVDFLVERRDRAAQIVIDGQSQAQTLADKLVEGGVPHAAIIRPSSRDMSAACAWIVNAVREGEVTHFAQPALDASATRTTKRRIGTAGGWGFESTDDGDATLIESCALAYWSAMTTKRDPKRRAVVF